MTTLMQKLRDPQGLVDAKKLTELDKKISACLTGMFRQPSQGGNPFLFALTIAKPHYLAADEAMAKISGYDGAGQTPILRCPTAATDGKAFYWHPDFLSKLSVSELPTVMEHEGLHVIFDHCHRMQHAMYTAKAYAIDYVVNSCIENNHKTLQRKGQLWGGNLGQPVALKTLLDHIDGLTDAFPEDKQARIFADIACFGRSPESIYDEIMEHWDKSPRKCKTCGGLTMDPKTKKPKKNPCSNRPGCKHGGMCCPTCGTELQAGPNGEGMPISGLPNPLDNHINTKVTRQEVRNEVMKAAEHTRSMRGVVPSEVSDMLGELMAPVISWTDIVFSDCLRAMADAGLRNDWSRPRKRWLATDPSQYLPKRYGHKKKWLALLDTSGSMSDKDMAFVTSQLQVLTARGSEGTIVPVDAVPHWGAATKVKDLASLKKTKVKGRGGTVFEEFFRDYRKKIGADFDAILILTDGDCGTIPKNLRPRIPVTWVLTHPKPGWAPTFGRTAPLRNERM